ncbi:MAG: MBL fold metallo-hydrolase [Candidatus Adlerbacteria bacterium]|nr:MBL fold metallo-hydrolase [Candidatus Adlerbacteria bacterium]
MVISYMGGECFKISQGELTLAFNLPGKSSKQKNVKFGSDIVLVSQDHEDFNGVEFAAFGEREPFVIKGPGEYEVKEIAVRGFGSETNYGGGTHINTIYGVAFEGMNLCFLGSLGTTDLPLAAKQELDNIDMLFLPIGGDGVLDYAQAYKLAVQLEPKVIIPMHYDAAALKLFLKEAGAEKTEAIDKFTVKKKDLEGKEGEIVVLAA